MKLPFAEMGKSVGGIGSEGGGENQQLILDRLDF